MLVNLNPGFDQISIKLIKTNLHNLNIVYRIASRSLIALT